MKRFGRILSAFLAALVLIGSAGTNIVRADNEEYGAEAYEDLKVICENFGWRINDNDRNGGDKTQLNNMARWINEKMSMWGYNVRYYDGAIENHTFRSLTYKKQGNSEKRIVIGAHYDCAETYGCEDNGTGVSLALELAKRFANTETNLSLEFCFWDGEEFRGMAGSYLYLEQVEDIQNIFCYINLDSIGSGDNMFVYGGEYDEDGVLQRSWGYNMAMTLSQELRVDIHEMPDGIGRYVRPTRDDASDQYYFNKRGIPYVYFEANAWLKPDGTEGNPEKPYNYNSVLDAFADENGRIIHTKYDNLQVLESIVPGRIQEHLTGFSRVTSEMIRRMDLSSPEKYAAYVHYTAPVVETTTEETTIEETTTEETETTTETEPETSEETVETTTEEPETIETDPETEKAAVPEKKPMDAAAWLAFIVLGAMGELAIVAIVRIIILSAKKNP